MTSDARSGPPEPPPASSSGRMMTPIADASGLPESDPLTPELLEDEAIRGDFVIRWAIVLLAFLLGCTEMGETQTLVHVKTGQYLLEHGLLPPRTDVFSYTAADRPWVNLSWLFDVLLAGADSLAGPIGLTILKALISAATFGFVVHSGLKGVSSWWGSVCAALALLACHAQFTALPELVTLLGLSFTLWRLSRWCDTDGATTLWPLVPAFLLWSNLDPRMFLGLGALLLFSLGESASARFSQTIGASAARRGQLWIVCGACVAAALVNPFGWHALLSPLSLYGDAYPALRGHYPLVASPFELQFRPISDRAFWTMLSHGSIAWLILVVAAMAALVLNRRRVSVADGLLMFGALVAAIPASHELAASAVVLAVVATRNAQAWYQTGFRQSFSVDRSEILFSRGGRAATVLALLGFAFLGASGRLPMPLGARVGFGWHPSLAGTLSTLDQELANLYDDRPFNFTMRMGDLLIWAGHKPFIDHRAAIYSGGGKDSLVALHNKTRQSLHGPRPANLIRGNRSEWRTTFDRLLVTAAVPDLSGSNPDYESLLDLLSNFNDWRLYRVGSACAVFYRRVPTTVDAAKNPDAAKFLADLAKKPELARHLEGLPPYLKEHPVEFVLQAYGPKEKPPGEGTAAARPWAGSTATYEGVLLKPRAILPPGVQAAQHYDLLLRHAMQGKLNLDARAAAAFSWIVIRRANQGLAENPNSAAGYRLLGSAYEFLGALEAQIASKDKGSAADFRRYYQAVGAYGQLLLLEPDDALVHFRLVDLYASRNKIDLALKHLDLGTEALTREQKRRGEADKSTEDLLDRSRKMRAGLEEAVAKVDDAIDRHKAENKSASLQELASFAYGRGCVLRAFEILQLDQTNVTANLEAGVFQSILMLEAGQPYNAAQFLQNVEREFEKMMRDQPVPAAWRFPAAMVALNSGDPKHAAALLARDLAGHEFQQLDMIAMTLPLVGQASLWPVAQLQAATVYLQQFPRQASELRMQIALCALEAGDRATAEAMLTEVAENIPDAPHRALARFYLSQLVEGQFETSPAKDRPASKDIFTPAKEKTDEETTPAPEKEKSPAKSETP